MENLKNRLVLIITYGIVLFSSCKNVQPKIDLESVRSDVISKKEYLFPEKFIKEIETGKFNVFYFEKYCLVHIPYKNSDALSSEPFSIVNIYYLENNKWIYDSCISYYYDLQLIEGDKKMFLSENNFCSMNGECNSYYEISFFNGKELLSLSKYEGFNNYVYLDFLLSYENYDDVLQYLNDTIGIEISLSNFEISDIGLKSYQLDKKSIVLTGVSDSLEVTEKLSTELIYLK